MLHRFAIARGTWGTGRVGPVGLGPNGTRSHEQSHPHLGLGYNDLGYDIMMKGILLSVTRKQVSWTSFSVELVNPANTARLEVKDHQ